MDSILATTNTETKSGINGTALKIIALVAMFIDHFTAVILQNKLALLIQAANLTTAQERAAWISSHPLWTFGPVILRLIGRFGFPLFVYLLVEGYTHTRSVKKYAINLAVFAAISELPFNLGFESKLFYPGYQNVFLTLFLGLLCIWAIDEFGFKREWNKKASLLFFPAVLVLGVFCGYLFGIGTPGAIINSFAEIPVYYYCLAGALILFIIMAIAGRKWDDAKKVQFIAIALSISAFGTIAELLKTDYSGVGILTIAVMYLFRAKKVKAFALGCTVLTVLNLAEITAYFMLIPVSKYNGERGPKINKYFFYAFYPVHLGLLYLVAYVLGIVGFALY